MTRLKDAALAFVGAKEIGIVPDELLFDESIRIIAVPDDDLVWEGKYDPSQFDEKLNCIKVKASFDWSDPDKWLIHERAHVALFARGLKNHCDKLHPYPSNPIERGAYKTQLYHLLRGGVDLGKIMGDPKHKVLRNKFEKHPILRGYYDEALSKWQSGNIASKAAGREF